MTVPPCSAMGRQCGELSVTLRIVDLEEDDATVHDWVGTWLMGHTERITFGTPFVEGGQLLVDATLHVGCKHLRHANGDGAECTAHGFRARLPERRRAPPADPKVGPERFRIMLDRKLTVLDLAPAPTPRRALPTLPSANPCVGAPCRTADHTRGAACCRDLTLDVVLPDVDDPLEALLRSRQSPYLCKVDRTSSEIVECEMISACAYLGDDHISCVLHGRVRPDGTPAKPELCFEWPDLKPGSVGHPGCRLLPGVRAPA